MTETTARIGRVLSWGNMASPRQRGVVADIGIMPGHVLTGEGLKSAGARLTVVFQDLRLTETPERFIDGNAWRWEDAPELSAKACADLLSLAREKRETDAEERDRRMSERAEAERAFEAELLALKPPWAKAVLVAVCDVDDCDTQTDYFAHKHGERVLLAWSKHTRDLFPEMRKAAAKFEKTRHLVDADEEAEHREKYSMGGGYYLKAGYCHDSGWRVRKADITNSSVHWLYPADLSLLKGKERGKA